MDFETHCVECGTPLKGRQVRTCSTRCRVADYRRSRRQGPKLRTCRLCGQPFTPTSRGRQSVCPYDDADDYCQGLQDDEEDLQAMRRAALEERVCEGPDCDQPIPYSGRGRPRRFCSRRCENRLRRQR